MIIQFLILFEEYRFFAEHLLKWLHRISMINLTFFSYCDLNAIAKSRQINWRIKRTKACGSICFLSNAKLSNILDFCRDKILYR